MSSVQAIAKSLQATKHFQPQDIDTGSRTYVALEGALEYKLLSHIENVLFGGDERIDG
jgi:hypothetical protein